MRKKITILKTLLLAVVLIVGSGNAWGQLLVNEDCTAATTTKSTATAIASGGLGWSSNGSGTTTFIVQNTSPITYTGYNGGGGNYIAVTKGNSTSINVGPTFSATASTNTFFYSFLINVGTLPTASQYFAALSTTISSGSYLAKLYIQNATGGYNLGISKFASTGSYKSSPTLLTAGTTYLVVVRYTYSTGNSTDDQMYLWINPTTSSEPITSSAEISDITGSDGSSLASNGVFTLRNSASSYPSYSIDGIKVAYGSNTATAWTNLGAGSTLATPPTLTADATANTVDNNLDITFTEDAVWRNAISAVKIGTTALTLTTDYVITSGNIQLKPSGLNALLTASGSKAITVVATGYTDATVAQVINAGAMSTANSTATISSALAPNTTSTITCTAKDKYNNLVQGYEFGWQSAVTNTTATTTESYTTGGVAKSVSDFGALTLTNTLGVSTLTVTLPTTIDANDGISIQIQTNDLSTNLSSAFSYSQLSPQTITFDALSNVTYGDANITLGAKASSDLTVTYQSSNTAVATVSGNIVTIVGAGSTNITASQTGNGSYNAATNVIQSLTVNAKILTLPDAAVTSKTYTGTNAAVITGTLTGVINADAVTLNGTGTFTDVNVADNIAVTSTSTLGGTKAGNYTLTQPTSLTGSITKASQTINLGTLTANSGDADFSPGATSATSATNAITYTSSNEAVATIVGNLIHIVGVGTSDITASQAASANYTAALDVVKTLTISSFAGPNVIITQAYGAGGNSGATYSNDYVELYNTTSQSIDITGWSIQYYTSAGTAVITVFTLPTNSTIKPYNYFLIQCSGGAIGTALPTPDATASTISMSSTSGKIVLYNNNTSHALANTTSSSSVTGITGYVDYIPYGASAVPILGSSTVDLSTTLAALRKSTTSYKYTNNIGADFSVVAPNPRNSGFTTSVNQLTSNFLSISTLNGKIQLNASAGETVNIYNAIGQQLLSKVAVEGLNTIAVTARGVVIVKVGNRVAKVIL
ncbi:MAG: lamin tail domain-containing protein [Paludibacter sp.]